MLLKTVRDYSKRGDATAIPNLVEVQQAAYNRFLQQDKTHDHRDQKMGLESLLREVFPIVSYDENMQLEYLYYKIDEPRYTPEECKELRLTYGMPFRVGVRLVRKDVSEIPEEEIYLGEIPILLGGGEFIINGAERVIVNQLHRSPGVDFSIASAEADRPLHSARIIPERGSWIELEVTKKDVLSMRIDQSTKIPATTFLRALDEKFSTTESLLKFFYDVESIPVADLKPEHYVAAPIIDTETGEEMVGLGAQVGENLEQILGGSVSSSADPRIQKFIKNDLEALVVNTDSKADAQAMKKRLLATLNAQPGQGWPIFNSQGVKIARDDLEALKETPEDAVPSKGWRPVKSFETDDKPGVILLRAPKFDNRVVYVGESQHCGTYIQELKAAHPTTGAAYPAVQEFLGLDSDSGKAAKKLVEKLGEQGGVNPPEAKDVTAIHRRIDGQQRQSLNEVQIVTNPSDMLLLNTLAEEKAGQVDGMEVSEHEAALLSLYGRLRPGNPPQVEKARALFTEKFFDENRYRLGKVGRFRINRKFDLDVDETEMQLRSEDFLKVIQYILDLRAQRNKAHVDDIDHLGNRRLRTLDELAVEEMRKGFLKLRRTVQERMSVKDPDELAKIADLINSKSISSAIDHFFGRGELSQVVDQTNPLSTLTHERRLSALGPGGLNRKRAGFEVRDVHISHYGRVCPIETPEGTNIGLIASLGIYSQIDPYGFLLTPYREVKEGKLTGNIVHLRADEEMKTTLGPADALDLNGKLMKGQVLARVDGDLAQVNSSQIDYVDISPKQLVGVSASLIPFLEHDDANRALMGSNMMRQAVPLIISEPPAVATGMEKQVPMYSGMVIRAKNAGTITYVDADRIVIDNADEYVLRKFVGLNERTCLNQKPIIRLGEKVKKDQIIADGAATQEGELALGKNALVAFNTFDGYNFEDAIVISERLVKEDVFTSIHIEEFDVEIRETKLGREEFTPDIPNVSEKMLSMLDENGTIRIGAYVKPGDILVGKVSPKSKSELTPEEKLLHAIFGRAGEDVKNDSLEVPAGTEGIVIGAKRFSRRMHLNDEQKKQLRREMREYEASMDERAAELFRQMIEQINEATGTPMVDPSTRQKAGASDITEVVMEQVDSFDASWIKGNKSTREEAEQVYRQFWPRIEALRKEKERKLAHMKRGDELPSGVLEMVKVYLATKRHLAVGDKMAGRHGNKGVIARIVPVEDMPFLEDGTPVDLLLNPLGVPSRMNVGQILETHLGWACGVLGFQAVTPVFDGATEDEIHKAIAEANQHVEDRLKECEETGTPPGDREILAKMPAGGKIQLYDGRTGEAFDQKTTVGHMYMLKLHHLVDDKIHARATGPYSLITQQPLGGKARTGGQRFGEMEVWALEAYGAAYILQELLTVKSDDVEGRTKIYESMVKGTNTLEAGMPVAFDVLCNEIKGLGLNITLEKAEFDGGGIL